MSILTDTKHFLKGQGIWSFFVWLNSESFVNKMDVDRDIERNGLG